MNLFKALLLVTLGVSAQPYALESDLDEPVTFTSDSFELDEQKGTTTYFGEVVVERGSMKINADTVTVYYSTEDDEGSVTKIVAKGKPASYEQKPNEEEDVIVARANTLEYSFKDESLHLIDQASLKQGGTSLTGNRIDYDARRSVVKAGGSLDRKERVRMVIPPKALQKRDTESNQESSSSPTTPQQPSNEAFNSEQAETTPINSVADNSAN